MSINRWMGKENVVHFTQEYHSALKKNEIYKKVFGFRMRNIKQGGPNPARTKN